jgi:hypothetical protein
MTGILPFCVESDQAEFRPDSFYDILDAEIELATHDGRMWFAREFVEEVEADAVDFVIDIETGPPSVKQKRGLFEGAREVHHRIYFRWSFIMTSMKSSTVAK